MQELFGDDGDLALATFRQHLPVEVQRVFYYHSLDDERREGEVDAAFEARKQAQLDRYDKINALPGFHTRLGSVTGKSVRRRRQKMVDVQLAVDALTHAFNKNIGIAVLFAGDLDFK